MFHNLEDSKSKFHKATLSLEKICQTISWRNGSLKLNFHWQPMSLNYNYLEINRNLMYKKMSWTYTSKSKFTKLWFNYTILSWHFISHKYKNPAIHTTKGYQSTPKIYEHQKLLKILAKPSVETGHPTQANHITHII